jgi:hypothetical protein
MGRGEFECPRRQVASCKVKNWNESDSQMAQCQAYFLYKSDEYPCFEDRKTEPR